MSDLVDKPEAAGLVTRERDPNDKCRTILAAAPEAVAKASAFYRDPGAVMAALLVLDLDHASGPIGRVDNCRRSR